MGYRAFSTEESQKAKDLGKDINVSCFNFFLTWLSFGSRLNEIILVNKNVFINTRKLSSWLLIVRLRMGPNKQWSN